MRLIRAVTVGAIAAIAVSVPARSPAQLAQKFVITPYAGVYVPSTDVATMTLPVSGTSVNLYAKHQASLALGTTASYWFTDRVAVEGGLVYSESNLKSSGILEEGGVQAITSNKEHANVWLGSAKVLFQLLPLENAFNLRLGVGPALITRSGTAYKSDAEGKVTGLTDVGGVVSLCSRIPLSELFSLRLRAEDYIYQTKLGFSSSVSPSQDLSFTAKKQSDFVFSLGFQMFLNK